MILISIPGSKSYTNRALIMAALTRGETTITNHLMSDDIEAMISCLRTLGLDIDITPDAITVHNSIHHLNHALSTLDCRQSGTTYRFILPIAALVPGTHVITGEKRLTQRPIKDLVDALKTIGMHIDYSVDIEGCQQIKIIGQTICHLERSGSGVERSPTDSVTISGKISSQFLTSILMIAPILPNGLTIHVTGDLISRPYIDMTLGMMHEWGIAVANDNYKTLSISPSTKLLQSAHDLPVMLSGSETSHAFVGLGSFTPVQDDRIEDILHNTYHLTSHAYRVEGDYSAAGYFFAIAALNKSTLTLQNLNLRSKQGDKKFMDFLMRERFISCHSEPAEESIVVTGLGIHPVTVNMEDFPDQAQTLAVLTAFAPGTTILTGIRSLRVKETERVHAIQTELAKMGIQTGSPDVDTLIIHGGSPHAATIDTYHDHRMAMSFSIAKTRLPDLTINNPEVVTKTFPKFWQEWAKIV